MWCWAASGQMIMQYLGHSPITQCGEASDYFGNGVNCCAPTPDATCINGGWPQFDKHGFGFQKTPELSAASALAWDDLRKEIDNNRPIAFAWHRKTGGGHMMVVIGYKIEDGKNFVVINDPWPPGVGAQYPLPYESFVAPDATYEHWLDFYDIVSTTGPGGDMPNNPTTAEDLAASLESVKTFLPTALKLVGKDAPGSAEASHLDDPLPSVEVGLNVLEKEAPGGDPEAIFSQQSHSILYPVMMGREMVSSIAASKQAPGGWSAAPTNLPWAQILLKERARHAAQTDTPPDSYFVVDVGALGLHFLATRHTGKLVLIPTRDEPDIGLRAGESLDATEVLSKLSALAKRCNEEPA
jgi:hypothetical protein